VSRSKDLANSEVRRVKAQAFGTQVTRTRGARRRIAVGSGSWEDRWIRTWDRASEPRSSGIRAGICLYIADRGEKRKKTEL
jgi:hypothetical protein